MWRDEIQAWLIARDSSGIPDLFRNLKYEGHPALWHLLLMPVTRLTSNPVGMQAVHFLIASTTVFVVAKHAPFTPLQKVLFSFGYFPLFQYGVVSRNYALSLLLVVILCVFLRQYRQKPLRVAGVLFLLSHTSVYACIIAIGVTLGLMLDYFLSGRRPMQNTTASAWKIHTAFSMMAAGIVTAALQMNPPADTYHSTHWNWTFELPRLEGLAIAVLHTITGPYVNEILPGFYKILAAGALFAAVAAYYWRRPAAVAMFSLSTLGLAAFFYARHSGGPRHWAFYLIAFLLLVWGGRYLAAFSQNGGSRLATTAKTFIGYLMTGFLLWQAASGIKAVAGDVQRPFSFGQQTAEYIRDQNLGSLPMIGVADYAASTVAAYLGPDSKIDYVRKNRGKSFIVWDNTWRKDGVSDAAAIAHAEKIAGHTGGKVLLVFNRQLSLKPGTAIRPIAAFAEPAFVTDEQFYLYLYEPPADGPPH